MLSKDEIRRADRFCFNHDRVHFVAARAAMRSILADYENVTPTEVTFSYGANGKPELSSLHESSLRFNLSHSRDCALLAVCVHSWVGVDIEFINPEFANQELANRFFSATEAARLLAVPAEERPAAFFSCWTRKEAYVKAVGKGLSLPLDSFVVAFGPSVPAALLRVTGSFSENSRWAMYDLPVSKGYAAALAVEGTDHRLVYKPWDWRL